MTDIRPATAADWPGLWEIFRAVVETGDTYPYAPDTTEEKKTHDRAEVLIQAEGARRHVDHNAAVWQRLASYSVLSTHRSLGSAMFKDAARPGSWLQSSARIPAAHSVRL
ncbi:MAG: hypothetical protein IIA35_05765 [Proteobacteria bacterium]|nr:hypothetical protein [Pseudomonadota bacterium]